MKDNKKKREKNSWRFFYHYFRYGDKKMSVHFRKKCINVDNIECLVPCATKFNKRQPLLVMQGYAKNVKIKGNTAIIE